MGYRWVSFFCKPGGTRFVLKCLKNASGGDGYKNSQTGESTVCTYTNNIKNFGDSGCWQWWGKRREKSRWEKDGQPQPGWEEEGRCWAIRSQETSMSGQQNGCSWVEDVTVLPFLSSSSQHSLQEEKAAATAAKRLFLHHRKGREVAVTGAGESCCFCFFLSHQGKWASREEEEAASLHPLQECFVGSLLSITHCHSKPLSITAMFLHGVAFRASVL